MFWFYFPFRTFTTKGRAEHDVQVSVMFCLHASRSLIRLVHYSLSYKYFWPRPQSTLSIRSLVWYSSFLIQSLSAAAKPRNLSWDCAFADLSPRFRWPATPDLFHLSLFHIISSPIFKTWLQQTQQTTAMAFILINRTALFVLLQQFSLVAMHSSMYSKWYGKRLGSIHPWSLGLLVCSSTSLNRRALDWCS